MTGRAVVIDAATGQIKRSITGSPAMMALQCAAGEAVFALLETDAGLIDDANLIISETGEWAARPDAPEGLTLPSVQIAYVPA